MGGPGGMPNQGFQGGMPPGPPMMKPGMPMGGPPGGMPGGPMGGPPGGMPGGPMGMKPGMPMGGPPGGMPPQMGGMPGGQMGGMPGGQMRTLTCEYCKRPKAENQLYTETKCPGHQNPVCYKCVRDYGQSKMCPVDQRDFSPNEVYYIQILMNSLGQLQ